MWIHIREAKSYYAYIYTHVDEFKVTNTYLKMWIDHISLVFLIKSHSYYNNNNFHDGTEVWTYGTKPTWKKHKPVWNKFLEVLQKAYWLPAEGFRIEANVPLLFDLVGHW